jgi:Cu(I)/Ag(I) efflux system membrane fusion protein
MIAAASTASVAGYFAGKRDVSFASMFTMATSTFAGGPREVSAATDPVIYYRHPDGAPLYSASPAITDDGRPFVPVRASEDISFDETVGGAGGETQVGASGDRRVLYYRNPMGLPDVSDAPKKDSMGMDYIPVYEGEDDDGSTVTLTAGRLQRTGVKTVLATKSTIVRPVRVPGSVTFDERRVSLVSTRTEAFIEEVSDVTTGTMVSEGDALVRIYAREIAAAGALYAADTRGGGGRNAAGGSLQRLQNLGVPADTIAEIESSGRAPLSATLTAPRSGIILERMAVEGMMVNAGDNLFRIADVSRVWVLADVPEFELNAIAPGARALITVRSLPGISFEGVVGVIYPEIRLETRSARVRIELPNQEGLLIANMYADVEIETGSTEAAVTVPDSAVIDTGDRRMVIVDLGGGRFEPRAVTTGKRGGGMLAITEGLEEGDRVVVSANFLIDAESNLRAALAALTAPGSEP